MINCARCNRLFNSLGYDLCPEHVKEEDEMLKKVNEYLRKHPNSSPNEVSEGAQVDEFWILRFIKQGRIKTVSPSGEVDRETLLRHKLGKDLERVAQELKKETERKKGFHIEEGFKK
ncbi:hypothetical protein TDSAC_1662 [Thermodesulfobium acidiphilum]|uniref:Uncharacterized protein n=2 Tax=Thermodesulfobium acidiphilum TaxID=1794699 RepID=A0A2R4W2R3_THEAF|nr:hypothetical protein TDSAC_1662 [Thermodesulfobium acidiphilum]